MTAVTTGHDDDGGCLVVVCRLLDNSRYGLIRGGPGLISDCFGGGITLRRVKAGRLGNGDRAVTQETLGRQGDGDGDGDDDGDGGDGDGDGDGVGGRGDGAMMISVRDGDGDG